MIKIFKYLLLFVVFITLATCKKRTTVNIRIYNYALDEPIANATVVLVQKKGESGGGIFSGNASCEELAVAQTNSDGYCSFDREKLRSGSKYKYFVGITNAYGAQQSYPCGGKTSGYLIKGEAQSQIINSESYDGFLRIQFNNLLNPSQPDDTLNVIVNLAYYNIPEGKYPYGGGGVLNFSVNNNINNPPNYPPIYLLDPVKTTGGKQIVKIRKRKLGIVTTSVDTIKVYPYQTTTVQINW